MRNLAQPFIDLCRNGFQHPGTISVRSVDVMTRRQPRTCPCGTLTFSKLSEASKISIISHQNHLCAFSMTNVVNMVIHGDSDASKNAVRPARIPLQNASACRRLIGTTKARYLPSSQSLRYSQINHQYPGAPIFFGKYQGGFITDNQCDKITHAVNQLHK